MKVYVAGSSDQLERVTRAMNTLEEMGHEITHDWPEQIRLVGAANDPDADIFDRARWARECLRGVADADMVLLLMPVEGGFGAAVELGYAIAKSIPIVCSGVHARSIFTAFAFCYDRDDQALAYFKERTRD